MESLAADAIYTMTCDILATAAEMEEHLEAIVSALANYKSSIQDSISEEAEQLVKDIRAKIDEIKEDCRERNENAKKGSILQAELEDAGVTG